MGLCGNLAINSIFSFANYNYKQTLPKIALICVHDTETLKTWTELLKSRFQVCLVLKVNKNIANRQNENSGNF